MKSSLHETEKTMTYGQETRSRDVDTVGVLEVLDGGTDGSLELDDSSSVVSDLGVDDDIEFDTAVIHDPLESLRGVRSVNLTRKEREQRSTNR